MSVKSSRTEVDLAGVSPAELRKFTSPMIALIDERPLVRDCLSLLLRRYAPDLALTSRSSPTEIRETELSLAVIWIERGGREGLRQMIQKFDGIRLRFPGCPIVALIECEDPDVVHAALKLGLNLIRLKTATREITLASIRLALAGGSFMSSELLEGQLHGTAGAFDFAGPQKAPPSAPTQSHPENEPPNFDGNYSQRVLESFSSRLTRRELDILERLDRGLQNKTIAYELGISCCTVKVHIQNIMKKLKARNRTEVAFLARRALVEPPVLN